MRKKIKALPAAVLLIMGTAFSAPAGGIKFQNLSIEHGLSQGSILSILQDSRGFLWFGTEEGLNRYDGYGFKHFKLKPGDPDSISNNTVWAIHEDSRGNLWAGTLGGLNRYDREKEVFVRYLHDPANPSSLSHNAVYAVHEDRSDVLWVATEGGGVNAYDRKTGRFTALWHDPLNPDSLSHNAVYAVCEDRSGALWFGTAGGLDKFDRKTKTFTRYRNNPADPQSLSHDGVRAVIEDREGALWVGTSGGGVSVLNPKTGKFIRYRHIPGDSESLIHDSVNCLFQDQAGDIWIGTQRGLSRFQPQRKTFQNFTSDPNNPESLSYNVVMTVYEDRTGVLWIGTRTMGANKYIPEKHRFMHYVNIPGDPSSLRFNQVRSFAEDEKGDIWVGMEGGGVDHFDRETGAFVHYGRRRGAADGLNDDSVFAVALDRTGILWVGTQRGGLNRLDPRTKTVRYYLRDPRNPNSLSHNTVRAILEDREGILWIGTDGGGLNRFDPRTETFARYRNVPGDASSLSSDFARVLYRDGEGFLWVGTFGGGLNRLDPNTGTFLRYRNDPKNPASLNNDFIMSLCEDSSGALWVGTNGGGLNRLDKATGVFTAVTEEDGLPSNSIYGILEDEAGNLWMSSNRGLTRFDPQTKKVKLYDRSDGLQSDEFNGGASFKSRNGIMYFGGTNGFNVFYPPDIKDNPHLPRVALTGFQIFNNPVPVGREVERSVVLEKSIVETASLRLTHRHSVVTFEFAALHFVAPEKNEFAYMMAGLEKDWNHVGNRRFVSYTHLPAGRYVFRVKASNNDGVWNEDGAALHITVVPPFWKTPLFRGAALLLVVLAAAAAVMRRTSDIRARALRLEKAVNERTAELRQEIGVRKRLENEANLQARRAMLIYETGRRMTGELKLEDLLPAVTTSIRDIFGYDSVMLFLLDEPAGHLVLKAHSCRDEDAFPGIEGMRIRVGTGVIGLAAERGTSYYSPDVGRDPHYRRHAREATKSEAAIPIISGRKVIGVLDLQSDKPEAFSESDIAAMETLGTQVSAAIEGARLYDQAEREISERTKAEKELERRQKYLEAVLFNAPSAIVTLDAAHKITVWNPGAERIFGYTPDEAVGRDIDELITRRDVLEEAKGLTRLSLQGQSIDSLETTRYRKDGAPVNVLVGGSAIRFGDGFEGVVAVYTDVTEMKKAQQESERRQKYLEAVLFNAPNAIVAADSRFRVTEWSPGAETMFGYSREEALGKNIDDLVVIPEHRAEAESISRLTGEGKTVEPLEVVRYRRDGTPVNVIIASSPISVGGKFVGGMAVYTDVTELVRARKEAEEANRTKSEFLANMSHEIRTPMNGIFGMTELALETELAPDQREYMEAVKASAESLMNIINDILDFSKIEARKIEFENISLSLRDTVHSIVSSLSLAADKKGLELAYHIPPDIPDRVRGDPGRLRQVLVNLLNNAVKFTSRGEVVVTVAEEARTEDTVRLRFSVRDTGIGIPPEKQKHIFDPFSQVDSSTTRVYGGTGLGLAIASQLVALMGGEIRVESEPGRGSTFHFTAVFPFQEGKEEEWTPINLDEIKGMPVLVVDDNATNRKILAEMLANWNMLPTPVESAAGAMEELKKKRDRPFRLILLDANMPEMDGFDLARKIKQDPELGDILIMMLSSAGFRGDAARCKQLGISAYLTKPVKQSYLLDAIMLVLGTSSKSRAETPLITRYTVRKTRTKLSILLAEDNIINQKLAVRVLEKHGHSVRVAENGLEVIAALEREPFDLILMDIQMPKMDGLEATVLIRKKEEGTGRRIPIIAMTAHAMKGDREKCLEAGMDDYISKPLNPIDMLKKIDNQMTRVRKTSKDAPPHPD